MAGSETWVWGGTPGPRTQKIHKKCWWRCNEAAPLRGVLEQGNRPKSKNLRCPVLLRSDGEGSTGGSSGLRWCLPFVHSFIHSMILISQMLLYNDRDANFLSHIAHRVVRKTWK